MKINPCKSCTWFVPKKVTKNDLESGGDSPVFHIGCCRRHAPAMNGYPVVFVNDWCGDHKLSEEYMRLIGG